MSKEYTRPQIEHILVELNRKFNIALHPADFKNTSYSASSLRDILMQRIGDELSGEWTNEKAMGILKGALEKMGFKSEQLHNEARLDVLFPAQGRRARVRQWSAAAGIELEVLKPNGFLYGLLIFLFFACIPLGIGMDWFFSGVCMASCLLLIFILGKTASNFKMQTLGQMAEAIAWKYYLQQQKEKSNYTPEAVASAVNALVKAS